MTTAAGSTLATRLMAEVAMPGSVNAGVSPLMKLVWIPPAVQLTVAESQLKPLAAVQTMGPGPRGGWVSVRVIWPLVAVLKVATRLEPTGGSHENTGVPVSVPV